MIKVILVSCFCSKTDDSNLVGNLQRKMSSVKDEDSQMTNVPQQSSGGKGPENDLLAKQ